MASKKSKILAMALCASVMTGIYASPVMAGQVTGLRDSTNTVLTADDTVSINGVEFTGTGTGVDGKVIAAGGKFTQLTVTSGMEITEGKLTVGVTSATIIDSANGNTVVGGTLTANGLASLKGGLNVSGDAGLTVSGDATLQKLSAGATTVDSLKSNGNAEVGGTLDVTGKATLKGGLAVTGGTETDTLNVTGAATVGDKLTVGNGLDVTGNALLNNDLTVNGATKLNGDVTVGGEATFNKEATFNGKAIFNENIDVNGFANLNSGAKVNGELTVNGATIVNNNLTVNGEALVNGSLDISNGKFKVDTAGNTEFNGNLNINHGAFEVTAADGSFSAARDKFNVFADGSFNAASENFEVSADGVINADSLYLQTYGGGTLEVGEALQALTDAKLPDKVGGIERESEGAGDPGDGTTTIENGAEFTEIAMTMGDTIVESGKITVGAEGDQTVIEGGAITTNTINAGGTIINNAGMTVGDTVVADSNITVGAEGDQTVIEGGAITAESLTLGSLNGREVGAVVNALEQKTGGIERVESTVAGAEYTTIIENGALKISDNGYITNGDDTFTIFSNGVFEMTGLDVNNSKFVVKDTGVHMNLGTGYDYRGASDGLNLGYVINDIDDRLDDLEYKTQNINGSEGTTAGGEGGTAAGEGNNIIDVPATEDGTTGINGNVTVGGEITAGAGNIGGIGMAGGTITTGNTTINGSGINTGNITAGTGNIGGIGMEEGTITAGNGNFTGEVTVGEGTDKTTINGSGINTGNGTFTGDVNVGNQVTVGKGTDKTTINGGTITTGATTIDGSGMTVGTGENATHITNNTVEAQNGNFNNLTAGSGTFGTGNNQTVINNDGVTVGDENGTSITGEGITVGDKNGVSIKNDEVRVGGGEDGKGGSYMNDTDVVSGEGVSLNQTAERVGHLENRVGELEDRIDKVGAMSAAIANLRTMGYDPAAPTEIAVGVGQYRDETGAALGLFHYPNRDFMLSLSVSTSGDEVMGGIGATWKFGRKSPEKVAEIKKAQAEADARRAEEAKLAKAEAMKKAAKEAKIKAQQERHAKLAAQAEAAK